MRFRDTAKWNVPLSGLLRMVLFNPLQGSHATFLFYVLNTSIFVVSPSVALLHGQKGLEMRWALSLQAVSLYSWLNTEVSCEGRCAWLSHSTWQESSYINSDIKEGFRVGASQRLHGPVSHQGFSSPSSPRCFPAEEIHMVVVCVFFCE